MSEMWQLYQIEIENQLDMKFIFSKMSILRLRHWLRISDWGNGGMRQAENYNGHWCGPRVWLRSDSHLTGAQCPLRVLIPARPRASTETRRDAGRGGGRVDTRQQALRPAPVSSVVPRSWSQHQAPACPSLQCQPSHTAEADMASMASLRHGHWSWWSGDH